MKKKLALLLALLIVSLVAARRLYMNPKLAEAAGNGDMGKVVALLKWGASVGGRGEHGRTPLHKAAQHGRMEVAELLVNKGADIDARDNSGKTPLHLAAWQAHEDIAAFLIAKGADVNALDVMRSAPLHSAVCSNDTDIVRLLITNGANVNVKNRHGWTPFDGADTYPIKALLVAHKGRSGNWLRKTVLTRPTRSELSQAHTDPRTSPSPTGADKIEVMAKSAPRRTVPVPIPADSDIPNIRGKDGRTPLHVAARNGRTETAEQLIEGGADVNARTVNKQTPLHMAAYGGHADIVSLLIANGAEVNTTDEENTTPLHASAVNGYKDVVKILIANGANVNARDVDGQTPLGSAQQLRRSEVVRLLQQHGAVLGEKVGRPPTPLTHRPVESVTLLLKNGNTFSGPLVMENTNTITLKVRGADITFSKQNIKERK